jgi:transcription initiation factor TFIID subunit TAF12
MCAHCSIHSLVESERLLHPLQQQQEEEYIFEEAEAGLTESEISDSFHQDVSECLCVRALHERSCENV